jgi:hypothetical protein
MQVLVMGVFDNSRVYRLDAFVCRQEMFGAGHNGAGQNVLDDGYPNLKGTVSRD